MKDEHFRRGDIVWYFGSDKNFVGSLCIVRYERLDGKYSITVGTNGPVMTVDRSDIAEDEPANIGTEQPKTSESDPVNHPSHYTQGGIECIDAIAAAVTGLTGMDAVLTAQVVKYIWRWKHKNGAEDLKKCRFYLDRLIKLAEVPNAE